MKPFMLSFDFVPFLVTGAIKRVMLLLTITLAFVIALAMQSLIVICFTPVELCFVSLFSLGTFLSLCFIRQSHLKKVFTNCSISLFWLPYVNIGLTLLACITFSWFLTWLHAELLYLFTHPFEQISFRMLLQPGHTVNVFVYLHDIAAILQQSCPDIWALELLTITKVRLTLLIAFLSLGVKVPSAIVPLFCYIVCIILLCWYTIAKILHHLNVLDLEHNMKYPVLRFLYRSIVSSLAAYLIYLWITVPPGTFGFAAVWAALTRFVNKVTQLYSSFDNLFELLVYLNKDPYVILIGLVVIFIIIIARIEANSNIGYNPTVEPEISIGNALGTGLLCLVAGAGFGGLLIIAHDSLDDSSIGFFRSNQLFAQDCYYEEDCHDAYQPHETYIHSMGKWSDYFGGGGGG